MAGTHDVYIYKTDCVYKVRPAVTMFKASAPRLPTRVKFRNLTGHDVALVVVPGFLFTPVVKRARRAVLEAGGPEVVVVPAGSGATVTLAVGLDGYYAYQALVLRDKEVVAAAGESAPGMIIDP